MKKILFRITILLAAFLGLIPKLFSQNESKLQKRNDAPVTIFYGLNESHSNSWARCTNNGVVGITYFSSQTNYSGNLIYKTIQPDSTENEEIVTTGIHLEISVLIFDNQSKPHIFVATSDNTDQIIRHFWKNESNVWQNETIVHFYNEGGKFIYELSADLGTNNNFHLLALKTRSNPDSDDYYMAFVNAHLYHITNASGSWQKELINNYDTNWTLDEYAKSFSRQDIEIDSSGFVHVIFGEQINGTSNYSPSRLQYATNKTGSWVIETAATYNAGTRDDGGWFPSLCLDNFGVPNISCTYIARVGSGSAMFAKLLFVTRNTDGSWTSETVATTDDGYYGSDGRDYTGGLTHLVFDKYNCPNIVFTDIASSHAGLNYFNLGNIRWAKKTDNTWNISTIYRQPLPTGFFDATEMYGMCLLISNDNDRIQLIGQQLVLTSNTDFQFSLIRKDVQTATTVNISSQKPVLLQYYPNPFNNETNISFALESASFVKLEIYNIKGELVSVLVNEKLSQGSYSYKFNASGLSSGEYLCKILISGNEYVTKMVLMK